MLINEGLILYLIKDSKSSGVLVEEVSWARLAQITRGAVHQGIAIQTAAAETLNLKTFSVKLSGHTPHPKRHPVIA